MKWDYLYRMSWIGKQVSWKWDAQICCCLIGLHVRGRRLALGWPPAMSQEERLSPCIGSPVCARQLGDFLAAQDRKNLCASLVFVHWMGNRFLGVGSEWSELEMECANLRIPFPAHLFSDPTHPVKIIPFHTSPSFLQAPPSEEKTRKAPANQKKP